MERTNSTSAWTRAAVALHPQQPPSGVRDRHQVLAIGGGAADQIAQDVDHGYERVRGAVGGEVAVCQRHRRVSVRVDLGPGRP
jgi:hypothetical protein